MNDTRLAAVARQPSLYEQAYALHIAGKIDEAEPFYEASLQRAEQFRADSLQMLGAIALDRKQYERSIELINASLAIEADSAVAWVNLSTAYSELGNHHAALVAAMRSAELAPDFANAHYNAGVSLRNLGRYTDAIASLTRSLALRGNHIDTIVRLALVFRTLDQFATAHRYYNLALSLDPTRADAAFGRAFCLLKEGRYAEGWPAYESRWKMPALAADHLRYPYPLWTGEQSLAGKTILVYKEQGFGDFIQFSRFIPALLALGARVLLDVPSELRPLYQSDAPMLIVGSSHESVAIEGAVDFCCPIMSLPLGLGISTPAEVPTFRLSAPPQRNLAWAQRLGPRRRSRVGLVWGGLAKFVSDQSRSIPFAVFSGLVTGGYDLVSLQKEIRPSDVEEFTQSPVRDFSAHVQDFGDTASLIEQMDLVISVDTSVAHLAASLGKPVWLLLSFDSDWRWLGNDMDTSPWYPFMRIFRQKQAGDWAALIQTVAEQLRKI